MAQVYVLYCDAPHGYWGASVAAQCPEQLRKEIAIDLETLTAQATTNAIPELDAADVAQVFGVGFSIVLLFFLVGRAVGSVLSLIRKG